LVERWFEAGKKLGWHKNDSEEVRRGNALRSRDGNELATARALMALVNVTKDNETHRKARADALYFYRLYSKRKRARV